MECFNKLARAMPDMRDSEVVIVAEKVRGSELPQCIYQMNERIANPRDFCAALAAGERLYSLYKFNQTGASSISVPELCSHYDVGKTKIYELLRGEYLTKEEAEKKPVRRIQPEKVEEEPPEKRSKKTKAAPTT